MSNDALELTYILGILNIVLRIGAIWLTWRPRITVFHIVLAATVIPYGIRPLLCAAEGGEVFYGTGLAWDWYNAGLFYQFIFDSFFVGTYLLLNGNGISVAGRPVCDIDIKAVAKITVIGLLTVIGIHVLSAGTWLPTGRGRALTMNLPGGPILLRFAVVMLSSTIPLAATLYCKNGKHGGSLAIVFVCIGVFGLTLLYQRGLALIGFEVALWVVTRNIKVKLRYFACVTVLLLIGIAVLRPAAQALSRQLNNNAQSIQSRTTLSAKASQKRTFRKELLTYTDSFCAADIWLIASSYVAQRGYMNGRGLLMTVATVIPARIRFANGLNTTNDELNLFYFGYWYTETQFGFNVNMAQNIYINYGPMFLWLAFVPGLITSRIDGWLWRQRRITVFTIFAACGAFLTGGFIGDVGVWSYGLMCLLVGVTYSVVCERKKNIRGRVLTNARSTFREVGY